MAKEFRERREPGFQELPHSGWGAPAINPENYCQDSPLFDQEEPTPTPLADRPIPPLPLGRCPVCLQDRQLLTADGRLREHTIDDPTGRIPGRVANCPGAGRPAGEEHQLPTHSTAVRLMS
jgi:hypothetical protein